MFVAINKAGVRVNILCDETVSSDLFSCPECGGALVLKKGKIRCHHFAHAAHTTTCSLASESADHLMAKAKLFAMMNKAGWTDVQLERPFNAVGRRADAYGVPPDDGSKNKRGIVFEVQRSGMELDEVCGRQHDYTSCGADVVWVPVLRGIDLNEMYASEVPEWDVTADFKVQDWQVLMMGCHGNRILSYLPRAKSLAILKCFRVRRAGNEWYSEDGELMSSSSYTLSNTYEAYVQLPSNNQDILVTKRERTKYEEMDYKKNWNLAAIFGPQVVEAGFRDNSTGRALVFPRCRPCE